MASGPRPAGWTFGLSNFPKTKLFGFEFPILLSEMSVTLRMEAVPGLPAGLSEWSQACPAVSSQKLCFHVVEMSTRLAEGGAAARSFDNVLALLLFLTAAASKPPRRHLIGFVSEAFWKSSLFLLIIAETCLPLFEIVLVSINSR